LSIIISTFVLFRLAIALFVLNLATACDWPFGIFNLLFIDNAIYRRESESIYIANTKEFNVARLRTNNAMARRKRTNVLIMIDKTLHRKLKIEQH
jgi:hypothetical protein